MKLTTYFAVLAFALSLIHPLSSQPHSPLSFFGDPKDNATRALASRARLVLGPEDAVIVATYEITQTDAVDNHWFKGRSAVDDRPTAYICRGTTCSAPITSVEELSPIEG